MSHDGSSLAQAGRFVNYAWGKTSEVSEDFGSLSNNSTDQNWVDLCDALT